MENLSLLAKIFCEIDIIRDVFPNKMMNSKSELIQLNKLLYKNGWFISSRIS